MAQTTVPQRAAAAAARVGGPAEVLTDDQVRAFVHEQLAGADLDGRSVCVLVPDGTRSGPMPLLLGAVHEALRGRVSRLTVLVALGTHARMGESELSRHLGYPAGGFAERYPGATVLNHEWWDPHTFATVGTIGADRIAELSEGRLHQSVEVRLNRAVVEHDVTLVVGPVFPHEVVGFSGGNKYFFPGVASQEVIDVSHWLGALITSATIIGTRGTTPVRALIDEAVALVPGDKLAFCVVVRSGATALHSLAFGEPVVADGGQVVLYAPHVAEISATHPEINEVGYHCRDYFVKQWDRFRIVPWGVLAHSTHLRGAGTYDESTGEERLRVTVTLATGIPAERVRRVDLDYLDPAEVDPAAWAADPDTMVVPHAGEDLFRLRAADHRN